MKTVLALMLAASLTAGNALAQGGPPAGKPAMGMDMMHLMMDQMMQHQQHMSPSTPAK